MNHAWVLAAGVAVLTLAAVRCEAQQKDAGKSAATQPASRPSTSKAGSAKSAARILCPVTGQPIDRANVVRFRGQWVYFADQQALRKFEQDPYEYADAVQVQWQADKPLRVQIKCPVTGRPPATEIYAGQGEDAVFFASAAARQKWLKDSAPYRKRLEAEGYTFQTGCATCGMDIDPRAAREIDDRTLYFCCDGCAAGFAQNKAEHLKNVDAQIEANRAAWLQRLLARWHAGPAEKEGEKKDDRDDNR